MSVVNRRLAVLLLFSTLGLFGCGGGERPIAQSAAADEDSKPSDGGTLIRRLQGDVSTLNPLLANSLIDRHVSHYLFTPMVNLDVNLLPAPGLANSWEISPDGKTYTFHLERRPSMTARPSAPAMWFGR